MGKADDIKVTVITPTYNRAHTLTNLYESLLKQTNKNFTWIIVDDGSKDNTQELIQQFINEKKLNIKTFKQENGGKHRALNYGIRHITTELTLIVDSDDVLTEDAIESIYSVWSKVENDNLCGISFLKGYKNKEGIGKKFSTDNSIDTFANERINRNITGDKAEVWVTKLLQKNPFLEFDNEKFFSERYTWLKVSSKHPMIFVNKIIYLAEYLTDGLSKSGRKLSINCPLGSMANAKAVMSNKFTLKIRIKNTWLYICYSLFANKNLKFMYKDSGQPLLISLNYIFGFLLYLYWKKKFI